MNRHQRELKAESIIDKLKGTQEKARNEVERNRKFYRDSIDIETDLVNRAAAIAERLLVAVLRENKVNVEIDVDDLVDKIVDRINVKMPVKIIESKEEPENSFEFDAPDLEPMKIKKYEIKGNIGNKTQTQDSTNDSLEALLGLGGA